MDESIIETSLFRNRYNNANSVPIGNRATAMGETSVTLHKPGQFLYDYTQLVITAIIAESDQREKYGFSRAERKIQAI
jgi:hypothetical protein